MVLVTGATGLVGSHLTANLLLQGRKVRALYRDKNKTENVREVLSFYTGEYDKYFSAIDWAEGDVTDVFSLEDALNGIEEVYHCAGYISFDEKESRQLHKINAEGTANVINISLGKNIKKFCHVSSVATLQIQANKKYIDEFSVWKTASGTTSYAISKYRGEFEAWRGMSEGLNVLVVNPSVVLGAGCWGQSSGKIITQMKEGFSFYTEGITGYVDVRDVVTCMIRLMDENKFGARYILNSENLSFQYLTNELRRLFGKRPSNLKAGSFLLNIARYADGVRCFFSGKPRLITKSIVASAHEKNYFDNSKIRKELGYSFIPVSESLSYITSRYNSFLQFKKIGKNT
ncbi:MAG: NAD-dependent epimerase/dehydratase family protein [Bacteroidia bacterium]